MNNEAENQKPENPPAFPSVHNEDAWIYKGMTLRDYFAAAAMQGYLAGMQDLGKCPSAVMLAKWSYEDADAMLKAREVK